MIYGYARCSTDESRQDIDRQKRELLLSGVEGIKNIYWEYESSKKEFRPEFVKLFGTRDKKGKLIGGRLSSGDTLIATEVSRITRSTKELCELIELIKELHLKLIIGTFVVDCSKGSMDAMTEGMLKMMGVFAEMERNMISERVKSGMKNAQAKGKVVGRPITTIENLPSNFLRYYPSYNNNQINVTEFARLCQISRQSIYKYLKIYENDLP